MDIVRRAAAALLLVCSALGVVLCLAALVGVWVVNQPAKNALAQTLDTLDGYLTLANQTVQQVGDGTTRLRATLDGARRQFADEPRAEERGAIANRVVATVRESGATLATLRNVIQTLSNSLATLNRTLAQLARLPSVVPPTLPTDLQGVEQNLSAISGRLDTLEARLADANQALTNLGSYVDSVADELRGLDDRLGEWTARLAAAQAAIAAAKTNLSTTVDLVSIGLSLLLVLFGAGQLSLVSQAWGWLRADRSGTDAWRPEGGAAAS